MHNDYAIDPEIKKPEIIINYNSNKGGVDTIYKMCSAYSTSFENKMVAIDNIFPTIKYS